MLTPEQLADLRAKAEAATPGPWHETFAQIVGTSDDHEDKDGVRICCSEDAAFRAAANPATVLQLLDTIYFLNREASCLATWLANYYIDDSLLPAQIREAARQAVRENTTNDEETI